MGKAKGKTLSRSNEGCFVTPVHCPRCGVAWGQAMDGLEKAAYTHLMVAPLSLFFVSARKPSAVRITPVCNGAQLCVTPPCGWPQTGIKTYCCSTCLCTFGCMTAVHKCPGCRKPFEYSPDGLLPPLSLTLSFPMLPSL